MGVYDEDVAGAQEAIREAGEPVRVITVGNTVSDHPWNPGVATEDEAAGFAVFLNFPGTRGDHGETRWHGTVVQAGDKKVLLSTQGLAAAPTVTSFIERADGTRYSVVNCVTLDPNGQHILYTMQVRR